MSNWRPRVVVLVAVTLGAAGCIGRSDSTTSNMPQEVRIGLIAAQSGDDKGAGVEAQRGAQLAADVVNGLNSLIPLPLANESGLTNLGNARIRIVLSRDVNKDTKGDASAAAANAAEEVTRLVAADGVSAIVGGYDADVTVAASQRAERIPIPFVNGDSSVSFLTQRGLDWFFRLGPSARTSGEAFFSLLKRAEAQHQPKQSIAIMHAGDRAGNDVNNVIHELAEEGGYEVVGDEQFAPNATDLSEAVARIKQKNPDVVFLAPTPRTVPVLVSGFVAQRYKPKGLMTYGSGFLENTVLKGAGQAATGLCREVSWSYDVASRNEAARAVNELYTRKYNSPMTEEAASTFTAVLTLAIAINNARSIEPRAIRSELLSLDIPGKDTIMPWAGIHFDETHENADTATVVEQFNDRKFQPVFPLDTASKNRQFKYPAEGATAPVSNPSTG